MIIMDHGIIKTNFNAPLYDVNGGTTCIDSSVCSFIEAGVLPKDINLGLAFMVGDGLMLQAKRITACTSWLKYHPE